MQTPREKFQELLKELFQFDCAELDFGIYRIMNQKRAVIERFIEKDLLEAVTTELSSGALAQESGLAHQLTEVAAKVRESFGDDSLDAEGNLVKGQDLPLGKEYLALRESAGKPKSSPELEAEIFNHLYSFFSRYYDEGDFMSLRRYSKRNKYAIPYNGEEVYLHWANSDQYYIKTAENFTDYSYKHGGWTVQFKLRNADVEQNNNKGAKRYFLPRLTDIALEAATRTLTIPFEYRPLTSQEEITFKSKPQETILTEAAAKIVEFAKPNTDALAALLHEKRKDADGNSVSLLDHHLRVYTRKNTSDFFIHKDLGGFLERELDFYLKNEVLNLDELEAGGETRAENWFQILRAIKGIGRKIITFVAQIENFQKRLFEKKKFVTEVQYCVTLDRVPEELYPEIAKNKAQIEEWKRLFHIHEIERSTRVKAATVSSKTSYAFKPSHSLELMLNDAEKTAEENEKKPEFPDVVPYNGPAFAEPPSVGFLKANQHLVLDTKFFNAEFTTNLIASEEILAGAATLDEAIDGVLIHGDNFQALGLIAERFRGEVQTMYLDPPYNTDAEPIIYKNDYKSSSWCSFIENRLRLSKKLLSTTGLVCITIDDYQVKELGFLAQEVFGHGNIGATVSIRNNPSGRPTPTGFGQAHEYAFFIKASSDAAFAKLPRTEAQKKRYKEEDTNGNYMWELFRKRGSGSERKDRRTLYYPIYAGPKGLRIPKMEWDDQKRDWIVLEKPHKDETAFWPIDENGIERRWRGAPDSLRASPTDFRIQTKSGGVANIYYKYRPDQEGVIPTTAWIDAKYSATEHGTGAIKALFSDYKIFDYPKSIFAVEDCIWVAGMDEGSGICLDFFAGSGTTAHACINLNRKDEGKRKYILIEAGEHFENVTKPRVLKVVYSDTWGEGRPISRRGSSHIIKYLRLESYEDALNNITFEAADAQTMFQLEDYVLSYMLDFETKQSETLLNVAKLDAPFDYKLRRHGKDEPLPVDLPETFNYLIGLHVASRRVHEKKGTRYLVYRGKVDGRETVILWRTTRGWQQKDFEADRDFVAQEKLTENAEDIFVNTDSFIPGAHSLDPVFKRRMFNEE